MAVRPIAFVKDHPVGFIASAAVGMIAGPWVLSTITRFTGVSVGLPSFRAGAHLSESE
jgi:hypothetical protein